MSEKVTFKELVEQIARRSKQSQSSTNNFIHELVKIIEKGLKDSGSVTISGFGKFELRWMNPRKSLHPKTGEQVSVPGQNKVVFKPFKNLRDEVNHPFAGLTSRVLKEAAEKFGDEAAPEATTFVSDTASKKSEDSDSLGGLLIEHENPRFQKTASEPEADSLQPAASERADELARTPDEEDQTEAETDQQEDGSSVAAPAPLLPASEEKALADEVQKAGSFRWSYAAAAILAILVFIILFFMYQQYQEASDTPEQAMPDLQGQPEQTESLPPSADAEQESAEENAASQTEPSPPGSGETQTEFETENFSVEPGQSLWTIAETQLGNPYLWPVLYHLNEDRMGNPNFLPVDSDIILPSISDPDHLNEFEREQVAHGYFKLYEWNVQNNPDEARFFLWAVGVFSSSLLDQPPSGVIQEDLEFARNR